jgi:hypothetical protein
MVMNPGLTPCIYVPGGKKIALKLKYGVAKLLDLFNLIKLALLNSVLENPSFQDYIEMVQESNPDFMQDLFKFLTSTNHCYENWIFAFQTKLYNLKRADPIPIVEEIIVRNIYPSGHLVSDRVQGLAIRIKNAIEHHNQDSDLVNFRHAIEEQEEMTSEVQIQDKCYYLLSFIMDAVRSLEQDKCAPEVLERLKSVIQKLHRDYGNRHSIYHFLEYLWLKLQGLVMDKSLSNDSIAGRLGADLQGFGDPAADRALGHLPFVDPRAERGTGDDVLVCTDGLFALLADGGKLQAMRAMADDCSLMAQTILNLRNLVAMVFKEKRLTLAQTKTKISDHHLLSDTLKQCTMVLVEDLNANSEKYELGLNINTLNVSDVIDKSGELRILLNKLITNYNSKLNVLGDLVNGLTFKQKKLSQISSLEMLKYNQDHLISRISSKYRCSEKNENYLMNLLKLEMRLDLQPVVLIEDDLTERVYVYLDRRVETLISMVEAHTLHRSQPQTLIGEQLKPLLKTLANRDFDTILRYETFLFSLLKEDEQGKYDPRLEGDEIVLAALSLQCPFRFALDMHRLLLLRKLQLLYRKNRSDVDRSSENKMAALVMIDPKTDNTKLEHLSTILAIIAEKKNLDEILKLVEEKNRRISWKKSLETVASLGDFIQLLTDGENSSSSINFSDLCYAANKWIEEEMKSNK